VEAIRIQAFLDYEGCIENLTRRFFESILSVIRVSGGKIKVKSPSSCIRVLPGINHTQVEAQINFRYSYSRD